MATELAVTDDNGDVDDRIRKIVWKGLGAKSVRQMSEETGLSPEQIFAVKRELLESVDVLTIQEKRQKLLVDLQDMAQRAQDDYDKAPFEFKSGLLNSATTSIKAILVELNRADKADQSKVDALNELRKREIVQMYIEVVNTAVTEVCERFDLDESEVFDIFNRQLVAAASKRDTQV